MRYVSMREGYNGRLTGYAIMGTNADGEPEMTGFKPSHNEHCPRCENKYLVWDEGAAYCDGCGGLFYDDEFIAQLEKHLKLKERREWDEANKAEGRAQ